MLNDKPDNFEKGLGCFFIVTVFLSIILVIAMIVGIIVAIDLAYENWG